jgi:molybdate transport system substrate-binding protein
MWLIFCFVYVTINEQKTAHPDLEIGFQQISENLPIEGAKYAGPIPSEYQRVTTFSAGITTRAKNASDAQRLVDYFSFAEVAASVAETGLEPVIAEK